MADELLNFVSVDGASFSGMPASKTKKDGTVVQARAKTPEPHWTELEAIYGPVDGSAQPDTNPITSGPNAGLRLKLPTFPGWSAWNAAHGADYTHQRKAAAAWKLHKRIWIAAAKKALGLPDPGRVDPSIANGDDNGTPTYQTTDPDALQRPMHWWIDGSWYAAPPAAHAAIQGEMLARIKANDRKQTRKTLIWGLLGVATGGTVIKLRGILGGS